MVSSVGTRLSRALAFSRLVAHFSPAFVPQSVRFRVAPCCQTGNNAAPASIRPRRFRTAICPYLLQESLRHVSHRYRLFRCWRVLLLAAIAAPALRGKRRPGRPGQGDAAQGHGRNARRSERSGRSRRNGLGKRPRQDNKKFAQQLLVSSLLQRGQLFAAAVFNVPAEDPQRGLRSMQFRQFALTDLQRAVSSMTSSSKRSC